MFKSFTARLFNIVIMSQFIVSCGNVVGDGESSFIGGWASNSEFARSFGADIVNAEALYARGGSGVGQIVAVIDSGIDIDHVEFTDRIHGASINILSPGSSFDDSDGHGTEVAGVIAAAYGNGGTQGIAYNAEIMAIETSELGFFSDPDLINAIDHAIDNNANVINMSLGGGSMTIALANAIQRATDAGIIVVASTGNDGNAFDVASPASDAGLAKYNGLFLAVGSVKRDFVGADEPSEATISDFSNRCNPADPAYCVTAPGEGIQTTAIGGGFVTVDGTSFSAPYVAGAIALLRQTFPSLTAAQAVEILITTAYDPNGTDIDLLYGNGIIDLENAEAPTSFLALEAGSTEAQGLTGSVSMGAAFGDAAKHHTQLANMVGYDAYDRAYSLNLANQFSVADVKPITTAFLDLTTSKDVNVEAGLLSANMKYSTDFKDETDISNVLADTFSLRANISSLVTLSYSYGSIDQNLPAHLQFNATQFGITGSNSDAYASLLGDTPQYAGVSQKVGKWFLGYGIGLGENNDVDVITASFNAARDFSNGMFVNLGMNVTQEDGSFLGTTATGSFDSDFNSLTKAIEIGLGYRADWGNVWGQYTAGNTDVSGRYSGVISDVSSFGTQALIAGLDLHDVAYENDRLGLVISRPLRVTSGSLAVSGQTLNGDTGEVEGLTSVDLRPSGQQTNIELGYSNQLGTNTTMDLGLGLISQAGHIADAKTQYAMGLRVKHAF
jgi:hypothetical protein